MEGSMKSHFSLVTAVFTLSISVAAYCQDPVVSKDGLSVHRIQRGDMPIVAQATGTIKSLQPFLAWLKISTNDHDPCQAGNSAKVELEPSKPPVDGRVLGVSERGGTFCEVEIYGEPPASIAVGREVTSLVDVGTLKNVIFFGRPAQSSAYGVAELFVLDSGSSFAYRTTVRYGLMSGPLIQVVSGLDPGDQVIVTDMSAWKSAKRVKLE
jgi:HlyD family secretion protein